ncbi:Monopolin complex subunit Csm1/Pcs1 [Penicillium argentinense]|uniref:Monopolin complex subunit Csm1/Pcs1 n=1 Tax=Penicillium argentinense TaxID=1131581 RepID=A0A9W9EYW9_9EURO|nr:Monopolin complex subunit Csm1/Pcs1 [Penicillium argentinense]KAJ5090559.1 Monopolin complex subunit Csm1/Pcs1 [Penicillium argentinense]
MPKRKAPTKISGLVDSDDEDIMQITGGEPLPQEPREEPPAKKRRGRPRSSKDHDAETKTMAQSKREEPAPALQEKAPPAKKAGRRGRPPGSSRNSAVARESVAPEPVAAEEPQGKENEESPSATEAKPTRTTRTGRAAGTRGRGRGRAASSARPSVTDGDFQYTPTRAQKPQPKPQAAETHESEAPDEAPEVEESILPDPQPFTTYAQSSVVKNAKARVSALRGSQDASPRKRKSGVYAEPSGDPELRRRIGELTKKNDTLEARYRDLKEIGVEEAKANMEKLRKQCNSITTASDNLVSSLKSEIAEQRALAQKSRELQKQLKERDAEVARLKIQAEESDGKFSSAQSEIKTLQTKLAAARNTAASLETAAKAPGSAIKGAAASRAAAAVTAEAAQSAHLAQLKEDLYSDLTGLIIRNVQTREDDHLYDCIQTGVNGTLHFKLAIPKSSSSDYEKDLYEYIPLVDANRDRDLVNILPGYLMDHITFERRAVTKFYTRVIDALTKRRSSSS